MIGYNVTWFLYLTPFIQSPINCFYSPKIKNLIDTPSNSL